MTKKKAGKVASGPDLGPRTPLKRTPANAKKLLADVTTTLGNLNRPEEPDGGDLVSAMMHIIFAEGLPCGYGQEVLHRFEAAFVDRNELRVTEAFEMVELLEDLEIPDLFERCASARHAIAEVYDDQNGVSLEYLREATLTDIKHMFMRMPSITRAVQDFVLGVQSIERAFT